MRQSTSQHTIQSYGLAVLAVVAAALVRWLLTPLLGPTTPFILFYPAVALCAWYGGLGPGLAATCLAGVLSCLFLAPIGSLRVHDPANWFSLGLFLLMGVLISILNESLHRARRQARQSALDLSATNERFKLLVESVQDYGIAMLDLRGNITTWNRGAEHISGYGTNEALGRHFSLFYPSEQIAGGRPQQELEIATTSGHFEAEGWQVRKDGGHFWASVVIAAIRDTEGSLHGFSYVMQDLTARKQAEEERTRLLAREQEARAESEASNRAKDEFLCVLSHELRTPLTSIIGWMGLLRRQKLPPEETERALDSVERSARVQARLVEDLLEASHMIAGKLPINRQPMQLGLAVRGAANAAGPAAEAKEINLSIGASASEAWVCGDALRLEQVFSNLLSNAIKFTPHGGTVEVRVALQNAHVEVAVCDTGSGIDAEHLDVIFDRFRQVDSSETRAYSGLGLGLAIVRYIVEAHEGSVDAYSEGPGKGTTFLVRLPLLTEGEMASIHSTRQQAAHLLS
jgi:PAS domain S-box-containing protein